MRQPRVHCCWPVFLIPCAILQAQVTHFETAAAAYNAHDYLTALRELQTSKSLHEPAAQRTLYIGMSQAQLGHWSESVPSLNTYLDTHPAAADASRAWYWLGNAQFFQKHFEDAKVAFNNSIAADPACASGYRGLGLAELELHNNQDAYHAWLKAVELDSKDEKSKYFLGRLFYEADLPNEAAAWLREAIQLAPGDWEAATYLGLCAEALGMDETAVQLYRRALSDSERNHKPYPLAFLSLANYLRKKGDDAGALSLLEQGARECPEASELTALGGMLTKTSQTARAEEVLRRAIQLDPALPQAHYRLALLLSALGKTQESSLEMTRFKVAKADEDRRIKVFAMRKR